MARSRHYLRFGELPLGKRSRVSEDYRRSVQARTGVLPPEFETGVSVFPTYKSKLLGRWVLPELAGMAASAGELWAAAESGEMPILLVTGRRARELGQDGEPLLVRNTIEIVERLKPAEVWSQGEGLEVPESLTSEERAGLRAALANEMAELLPR
jgi:hypothetical protein